MKIDRVKEWLVAPYKQGDAIRALRAEVGGSLGDVDQGICLSLCNAWIEMHMLARDNGSGEKLRELAVYQRQMELQIYNGQTFLKAMNSQIHYQASEDADPQNASSRYGFNLKLCGNENFFQIDDYDIFDRGSHSYTIFGLSDASSGHAICMYQSSGKLFGFGAHYYIYDPNIGEFKVPKDEFRAFFVGLLGSYALGGPRKEWQHIRYWDVQRA